MMMKSFRFNDLQKRNRTNMDLFPANLAGYSGQRVRLEDAAMTQGKCSGIAKLNLRTLMFSKGWNMLTGQK